MTSPLPGAPIAPPPPGQPYPPPPASARPVGQRGPIGVWILAGVAALASVAAIVLGAVAVTKSTQAPSAAPAPTITAPPAAPVIFDDDADRALCQAIPDLMRERDEADQAFQALPPAQTPERDAAIPGYKAGVHDWANRIQKVLASHVEPDRYLTRTLQRYIDDKLLYAQNIYPNKPADPFDKDTWNVGVVDYGGALGRCQQLGIHW